MSIRTATIAALLGAPALLASLRLLRWLWLPLVAWDFFPLMAGLAGATMVATPCFAAASVLLAALRRKTAWPVLAATWACAAVEAWAFLWVVRAVISRT